MSAARDNIIRVQLVDRWNRMCSHIRAREIRSRSRSSSLTRKIGRQCRLIGDDMTARYQPNRREEFRVEVPRMNLDRSLFVAGLVTSVHIILILSQKLWFITIPLGSTTIFGSNGSMSENVNSWNLVKHLDVSFKTASQISRQCSLFLNLKCRYLCHHSEINYCLSFDLQEFRAVAMNW